MNFKKSKKLYLLAAAPLPLIALSANENSNTVSKEFDGFKDIVDNLIKTSLSDLLTKKIDELREKAGQLLSFSNKDNPNDRQELVDAVYLQKIADYLESNKDEILKDPKKFGLEIEFPHIISQYKSLNILNITFNGDTFNNIKVGSSSNYDNPDFIKSQSYSTIVNSETAETVKNKTESYFSDLGAQFEDIFTNPVDIPQLRITNEKDAAQVSLTNLSFNETHTGLEISVPEGYTDWNDYIKKHIFKRFATFDLVKNSNSEQQEEDDPIPPLIQNEPATDSFDIEREIQNVPNLTPFVKYEYFDTFSVANYDSYVKELESNAKAFNQKFFFNNPVLTRYQYAIKKLEKDGENIKAIVEIADQVNLTHTREYSTVITKLDSKNITRSKEAAYLLLRKTFTKLYSALGIGEQINLKKLNNNSLSVATFNLVVEAVKTLSLPEFIERENALVSDYADQIDSLQISPNSVYGKKLLNLFLGSLERIDLKIGTITYNYFDYLIQTYFDLVFKFQTETSNNQREVVIKNNFNKFGYATSIYQNGFKTLKNDLILAKGLLNSTNFDINAKFSHYTNIISQIQFILNNLSYLSINEVLDNKNESQKVKNFQEAYKNLENLQAISIPTKKKTILITIGSILLAFSALFSLIIGSINRLKKQNKQGMNKTQIILLAVISITIFLISVVLIGLGIGGW
ncbi:MSC_0620 family F1-like ATPase-associated subunit [Mycoplasma hafezii]|uniref:MSC_0620 family F1-like ATPase-associated subunit n=1 Tax=Mycoplasma hafezii TaxID=525886 RepID=UPI003CF91E5B